MLRQPVQELPAPCLGPSRQGYVAWRGLVPEQELKPHVLDFIGNKFTVHQVCADWLVGTNSRCLHGRAVGPNAEHIIALLSPLSLHPLSSCTRRCHALTSLPTCSLVLMAAPSREGGASTGCAACRDQAGLMLACILGSAYLPSAACGLALPSVAQCEATSCRAPLVVAGVVCQYPRGQPARPV